MVKEQTKAQTQCRLKLRTMAFGKQSDCNYVMESVANKLKLKQKSPSVGMLISGLVGTKKCENWNIDFGFKRWLETGAVLRTHREAETFITDCMVITIILMMITRGLYLPRSGSVIEHEAIIKERPLVDIEEIRPDINKIWRIQVKLAENERILPSSWIINMAKRIPRRAKKTSSTENRKSRSRIRRKPEIDELVLLKADFPRNTYEKNKDGVCQSAVVRIANGNTLTRASFGDLADLGSVAEIEKKSLDAVNHTSCLCAPNEGDDSGDLRTDIEIVRGNLINNVISARCVL
ncbi:hypothetical protein DINM_001465 [Dirofilaria immitis]|nr:hypothetical protein [Dirofilaria immitis]